MRMAPYKIRICARYLLSLPMIESCMTEYIHKKMKISRTYKYTDFQLIPHLHINVNTHGRILYNLDHDLSGNP